MKTIYFIRHAQSEANLQDILASRQDYPLSVKGRQDAEAIAVAFSQIAVLDRVISSPLSRAQQTAAPIAAQFGLEVETDERLTEQELGVFAGMSYAELELRSDYMHERSKRWSWVPAGCGESYDMIAQRLVPFFKDLETLEGTNVLFVTHAVTMRLIRATLEQTLPDYPREIARNGEIWKTTFSKLGEAHRVDSIFLGDARNAISRA